MQGKKYLENQYTVSSYLLEFRWLPGLCKIGSSCIFYGGEDPDSVFISTIIWYGHRGMSGQGEPVVYFSYLYIYPSLPLCRRDTVWPLVHCALKSFIPPFEPFKYFPLLLLYHCQPKKFIKSSSTYKKHELIKLCQCTVFCIEFGQA